MTRSILAAALALLIATPAFANSCPTKVKAIDEALAANPNVSAEQLAQVEKLRDQGEDLHESGNHAESEKVLQQAMDILGL
ncbi:MAG TPA: hypothetical protein VH835_07005 [Dongiaceae bacterium]|jgi:hypothetical protein